MLLHRLMRRSLDCTACCGVLGPTGDWPWSPYLSVSAVKGPCARGGAQLERVAQTEAVGLDLPAAASARAPARGNSLAVRPHSSGS